MRIIITSLLSPWDPRHGGGQLTTHNVAAALSRRGHHVTVVHTSEGGGRPAGTPGSLPYRAEFLAHRERMYRTPRDVARFLRESGEDVDVVYTKGFTGAFLPHGPGPSPVWISTTHHPDPPDLSSPPGWGRPVQRARWSRGHVLALLERRSLQRSDAVVCVSHHSARVLRERGYLTPATDVRVVHNGSPTVGIERAASAAGDRSAGPMAMLCIARLDEHKGIDVLFRALARLGDLDLRLDLVGAGHAERRLREEAERLGLDSTVCWHGYAPPDRAREFLAGAQLLVLPSRAENFPLVILEALHAGLPIVATTAGGIPEAVRHEQEALLVEPEDAEALAAAIRRVATDGRLRERLAAGAARRADEFTWRRAAERLERICIELRG